MEDGAYQQALGLLYCLSYTIKMSKNSAWCPEGYYDFVVPPLEGLWDQGGRQGMDYAHKEQLSWTAFIRQPEFVTEAVFDQACAEAVSYTHLKNTYLVKRKAQTTTSCC